MDEFSIDCPCAIVALAVFHFCDHHFKKVVKLKKEKVLVLNLILCFLSGFFQFINGIIFPKLHFRIVSSAAY